MPALTDKKYIDAAGLTYLMRKIMMKYPDNTAVQAIVDAIEEALDEKADVEDLGTLAFNNTASGEFTPAGSVAAPGITVVPATTTVNGIVTVGELPSFSVNVEDETLSFTFDPGALPTKSADITVATGISSATATAPAFTGTLATITVGGGSS